MTTAQSALPGFFRGRCRPLPDTDCLEWLGPVNDGGYGIATWAGRTWTASRLMAVLTQRPVLDGDHVHHLCGRPICVEPLHLQVLDAVAHAALHVAARDKCRRGHPRPPGTACLDCARRASRLWKLRNRRPS